MFASLELLLPELSEDLHSQRPRGRCSLSFVTSWKLFLSSNPARNALFGPEIVLFSSISTLNPARNEALNISKRQGRAIKKSHQEVPEVLEVGQAEGHLLLRFLRLNTFASSGKHAQNSFQSPFVLGFSSFSSFFIVFQWFFTISPNFHHLYPSPAGPCALASASASFPAAA